jgi:hypothetical protein
MSWPEALPAPAAEAYALFQLVGRWRGIGASTEDSGQGQRTDRMGGIKRQERGHGSWARRACEGHATVEPSLRIASSPLGNERGTHPPVDLGAAMKPALTMPLFALLLLLLFVACGGVETPTTVIGKWEVSSVEGTQGLTIPAKNVLQIGLDESGGVHFVSCLDPVYEGTSLFTCHEQLVCATGTYTYADSILTITQTDTTSTHAAKVTFAPGEMVLGGEFFGPTYKAVHFSELPALSTSCLPLP